MAKKSKVKLWLVSSGTQKAEPFVSLDVALDFARSEAASKKTVVLESKDVTQQEFKRISPSLHHA